jgi:tRNA threonylcarbamoyl adenosine modification protein (Sua5/YciO/YrdC/YwlC family)
MEEPLRGYFTRSTVTRVAAVLRDGGVAVLPTDTIYGLHCAASHPAALRRIQRIKKTANRAGFILIASDMEMVDRLVGRWPRGARELLGRTWPAPLTAILPASKIIDPAIVPTGTIAVRIPALAELRRCVKLVGQPCASTSVNLSGRKPLTRMSDILRGIPGLDGYISQRGRPSMKPSTIVDMATAPPRLLRPGRYPWPLE